MNEYCKDPHRQGAVDEAGDRRLLPLPGLTIEPPPKEIGPEPLYRVVYAIDIGARNPREAAERAHEIMMDPASLPPVLHIMDSGGGEEVIDLAASEAKGSPQSDESREKIRRFVLAGGTQCPECGGEDIDFGPVELDAQCACQEASCRRCEARFSGVYRLVGYGLHVGDSFEVHTLAERFIEIEGDKP